MIDEEKFHYIREEALRRIVDIANSEGKDAFAANRYLLEGDWFLGTKVGRPSNEAIIQEAKALVERNKKIEDDYERIIKNGTTSL